MTLPKLPKQTPEAIEAGMAKHTYFVVSVPNQPDPNGGDTGRNRMFYRYPTFLEWNAYTSMLRDSKTPMSDALRICIGLCMTHDEAELKAIADYRAGFVNHVVKEISSKLDDGVEKEVEKKE